MILGGLFFAKEKEHFLHIGVPILDGSIAASSNMLQNMISVGDQLSTHRYGHHQHDLGPPRIDGHYFRLDPGLLRRGTLADGLLA